MDPPPPPQPPPPSAAAAAAAPDSADSSPRSRTTESYFNEPPLLPSKLRLMCSYGGHIVPRPHDKSLCYVGGDTRIVVVDRHTSLSSLSSRLANTLLNGRDFTLKYQLPSEDLDSLISVTTDEDLENMIDEYDRTNSNSGGKQSRLRLFLFPLKPDSSQSIGPILESNGKSEDWFLNALNGAASGLLNRGFSDSASVNCLLGLDDDSLNGNNINNSNNNNNLGAGVVEALQKNAKQGQDVHSVPDSPMLDTTSSFGSTSSMPSLANLPPIRVHVEDGGGVRGGLQDQKVVGVGVGIEEQFAQVTVSGGGVVGQKQDEGFMAISSPPPMPVSLAISGVPVGSPMVVVGDYHNRVFSDDERSDLGVPLGYRKPPPPQSQPQTMVPQTQQKSSSGGEPQLPSPDSISSDSSLSSAINRQKPMIYQDQVMQIPAGVSRVTSSPVDPKMTFSDPNPRVQIQQQVQDSGYVMQHQFEQQQQQQQQPQQFIHAGTHYVQHHPSGAVPMPTYYSVYPPPQQQHHIQHHHQLDQQYPVYYVQARQQPQPYNLPMQQQSSINESTPTVPSTPQTQPNPTMAPPQATYNHPMRNAPMPKPEMPNSGMYRTATGGTPQLVQVSSNQHQQQYVGYSQVHHPTQSGSPVSGVPANYAYEFADPAHAQIYYTQHIAPTIPSHYQTMTAGGAVVMSESSQLPNEGIKQQQNRTSQPI
ncbi:Octicosapeptide/Phox/Bem1p family protein [Euphorbia peplus]|nr:Octicosapeptide/Phox/Bem1p family protein [Euphorbia peplus]